MRVILVLSICFLSCLGSKAQNEEELIKNFVEDLFNSNVPAESVIQDYMQDLIHDSSFTVSLEKRNETRLRYVNLIREKMNEDEEKISWLTPGISNADPQNIVRPYLKYVELDKFNFKEHVDEGTTNNMYVLLDKNESEILQYFLVENGKIKSFTLFVKSGDASFFEF